ncbi:hypothetical protein [Clostridium sp. M14]|uniref:hypothetical protein n=1 Tax=Clostridium sp. M14 TaxID=2716311 RepID=UPI0013EEA514|nr:hypothetical protein [Clostridium sp. M14]MBZ9693181.1 hypothetical protein [Clostridium sp. M14]
MPVKKETNKRLCTGNCKRELTDSNFYNSTSPLFDGKVSICKKCIKELINYDDMNTVYNVLQTMDIPFLSDYWDNCLKKKGDTFGNYMRQVNSLPQIKNLRYKDSIFQNNSNQKKNEIVNDSNEISDILIKKWGSKYSYKQIESLENFYKQMIESYDVKTASHKDYLLKICKVSLKMDEALDNDNVGEFEKYSRVYDNLMKSAKFTAVQRSSVEDTGGFATFSEFIEGLERDGFIEPAKITEDYDIVEATISDLKNYTKKLVLGDSSISTMAIEQLNKIKEKEENENGDVNV